MKSSGHLIEVQSTGDVSLDTLIQKAGVYTSIIHGLQRSLDNPTVRIKEGHRTKFNPEGSWCILAMNPGAVGRRIEHLKYLREKLEDVTAAIEPRLTQRKQDALTPAELILASKKILRESSRHIS